MAITKGPRPSTAPGHQPTPPAQAAITARFPRRGLAQRRADEDYDDDDDDDDDDYDDDDVDVDDDDDSDGDDGDSV